MADSRDKRAAEIQDSIRQVLYHEWDPIGVAGFGPEDEYDSYIAPVYRRLTESRSEGEIMALLLRLTEDLIGDSRDVGPSDRLRTIARRLLEIDVKV